MEEKILKIFDTNTEAIATNRGFYYQYLSVLKKWIENYINEEDIETFTEVDNDIKEVGENLIFTQIKCYTSSFSLNSPEIKKAIFDFFILYLKYRTVNDKITFCFSTNSSIATREKLLSKWVNDLELNERELLSICSKKIKEILINGINRRKNKKLQNNITKINKNEIKEISETFKKYIKKTDIQSFVKSINWEFNNASPEDSIITIRNKIRILLKHPKFDNKPTSLLFGVLLSEIYKNSQNKDKKDRCLSKQTILKILEHTDEELKGYVDNKFIKLLRIDVEILITEVEQIKEQIEGQGLDIKSLKNKYSQFSQKEYAKNLTLLPDLYTIDFCGWEGFLNQTNSILKEKKIVSIYSEGGMGKTSFAKKYLKIFTGYDHIIWINAEHSIDSSFTSDDLLQRNLGIEFSTNDDIGKRFNYLLNELGKVSGENLLIVDIQESEDEIISLKLISSIPNWEKLILTRSHLKIIPSLKLPKISFDNAKEIYLSFCSKEIIEDSLFKDFFNYIDYNVLVIELTAKTIENSFDLTLEKIFYSIKDQSIDDNNFNIDIEIRGEDKSIKIFNFLIKKFGVNNLIPIEKIYFNFLTLLPSNNILIEDLILINGTELYNENKITIINIINSLDKKGLIEFSSDRKRINIHKIVREVTIYSERKELNPFSSSMLYITWLTHRIEEGYNSPNKSFRFLKYAESILNSVKEKYRKSLYQPLLLLENELLYSNRFYIKTTNELNKSIDLVKRAKMFSGLDTRSLAVMYSNLGLAYADNYNNEKAINYFEKALNIFKKNENNCLNLIIIVLNNISLVYLNNGDLKGSMMNFKKVQSIRKKYSLYDDQQLGIEHRILAKSYRIEGNYEKAIELLNEGIQLHKSINPLKRNDFYLAAYYSELSNLCLLIENIEDAIYNQELGIKILEEMDLQKSEYIFFMYQIILKLYQFRGLKDKEKKVFSKINSFKNIYHIENI